MTNVFYKKMMMYNIYDDDDNDDIYIYSPINDQFIIQIPFLISNEW